VARAVVQLSFSLVFAAMASADSPASGPCSDLRTISVDAFKKRDEESAHRLFSCLPKIGKLAVFQGDVAVSEADLQQYISGTGAANVLPHFGLSDFHDLKVDEKYGILNYWRVQRDRKMTYALDGKSFPKTSDYYAVQKAFVAAAADWVATCRECGISFDYRWALDWKDPVPSTNLTFVISRRKSDGAFVALSFFPDQPTEQRVVHVDDSFQTTIHDPVGIFRHEIGHILGYRHERPDDPTSGCALENGSWFPITEAPDESVMQYTCGTTGKPRTFKITDSDRIGHRQLYLGASFLERVGALSPVDQKRKLKGFLNTLR
jgi:hypothetical protein